VIENVPLDVYCRRSLLAVATIVIYTNLKLAPTLRLGQTARSRTRQGLKQQVKFARMIKPLSAV
jgi:hypothetical protein